MLHHTGLNSLYSVSELVIKISRSESDVKKGVSTDGIVLKYTIYDFLETHLYSNHQVLGRER